MSRRLGIVVALYVGIYLAWLLAGVGFAHNLIGSAAFLPLTALAVVACWGAGERSAAIPGLRGGWRLIAAGLSLYGLGSAVQLLYEALSGELPFPSLADPLYLAFYPLFFVGIMRFPWGGRASVSRRLQATLDAIVIAVGGGIVVWYLVLGPTAYESEGAATETLISAAYPVGDLFLVAALAWLVVGNRGAALRRPLLVLSAAILCFLVADVGYTWLELNSTYAGGDWVDAFYLAATGLFVVAAASQPAIEAGEAEVEVEEQSRSPLLVALPYLGTIVAFALLIGAQAGDSFFPGFSLTLTAAFVAMLVLSREALSQRELASANAAIREAKSELEALATTDPLTALPNHRALVDALDRELDRSIRYGRPCGVVFVDIDYFKALNDSCGHAAGDSVLVELGEVMQSALRRIDTVGRWGGEEFIAVLPEVDAGEALLAAERLRAKVAEHIFDVAFGTRVTVSVGAAGYPRDGATRNRLVEAADRAMYTAKRMGRNQAFDAADPAVAALRGAGQDWSESDERATMGAVDALATLVETRDKGTDDHSQKMARLAEQIALVMGCTPEQARDVFLAARLHDIGKVAVADAILRKPGKLTEEEWDLMRKHPTVGADVVSKVGRLANLAPIIRSHHEHYDGGGYPGGLKGRDIPLEARIVGVADAFDAMTRDRPYRGSLKPDEAREELRRYAGSQFDPEVVAVLDSILGEEAEAETPALRGEQ